jgi:alpha-mannosidase
MGGEANNTTALRSAYPKLAAGPVGKQITSIYQGRLRQFMDQGQYKAQGIFG